MIRQSQRQTKIEIDIHLPEPHEKQALFIDSTAKRKVVKAGRRGGKTVGAGMLGVDRFCNAKRVLYAAPTTEQISRFWATIVRSLQPAIDKGVFYKNETEHFIERRGTEQRIKAKTAWNADSLRGDYADLLILDEWQLMNEDAWGLVGAPMLLDNDGDAVFIYTPPSLHSRSTSKANDPQHAAKLFKRAKAQSILRPNRWQVFHFSSMDNPHISADALSEITSDMTDLAYRMEILAEDIDEAPGALWTRKTIEDNRLAVGPGGYSKIVVAVDPTISTTGDAAGIIAAGMLDGHGYVLRDATIQGSPLTWATAAVNLYKELEANLIVAEKNQGGEMVRSTLQQVDKDVPIKLVHASRGKVVRAEPVAAKYEKGMVHHIGSFPLLEDELCLYLPGDPSPNRMDALVYAVTELIGESFFSDAEIKDFPDE